MFTVVVSVECLQWLCQCLCNDLYTDEKKKKHTPHCNCFRRTVLVCEYDITYIVMEETLGWL